MDATVDRALAPDNPFSAPSTLPYELPPFGEIRTEHYAPALRAGMAEHRAELEDLLAQDLPATEFLAGLQRSGRLLGRVGAVFFNLLGTDADEEMNAVRAEFAPLLAAHADAVRLDPRLVARIAALHADRDELDPESRRLLERLHDDAARSGALLAPDDQERLRALNAELSSLTSAFDTELLADANARAVLVTDVAELEGLSAAEVERARAAAEVRGEAGWLLPLVLPTPQPVLESLVRRDVRERVHRAAVARGSAGGPHPTVDLVLRTVRLRAERAELLGFASHAEWVVADETAGSAAAARGLLDRLVPAAVANARAEIAELEELLHADGHEGPLQPWDHAYYAARLRRKRFDLDPEGLREFFELDRVLVDGVFAAAHGLYGLRFEPRPDLPGYSRGVRVFEVFDEDGPVGSYLFDPWARPAKRGGAWMSSFVEQSRLLGQRPVVVNCLNVAEPPAGAPALLTPDEVVTLFHEFGHTVHGLLSDVRYPQFSGTSVPRDFVEFPSQVNEMWAFDPDVLVGYARHVETGAVLPVATAEALRAAERSGQGFATTEYLAASLLDQAWHGLGAVDAAAVTDVEEFEAAALRAAGVDVPAVPPRYRSGYFAHVFAGGYAAAYYAYIWSEVLDADTVEWFTENGGLTRANGERFRRGLLARGGSVDPLQAYREVRGRDARIEPLLRRRGLAAVG
ncbi:M3 family metallopeptidase [Kineococcus gynurae]|uniref:M3 family metallopeptidase n=1 Tax=Kineococcus gynurae TaxID=452979 RepID=A0ABV5LWJ2_9ACTN